MGQKARETRACMSTMNVPSTALSYGIEDTQGMDSQCWWIHNMRELGEIRCEEKSKPAGSFQLQEARCHWTGIHFNPSRKAVVISGAQTFLPGVVSLC